MFFTFWKLHFVQILIFYEIVWNMERAEDIFGFVGKERLEINCPMPATTHGF